MGEGFIEVVPLGRDQAQVGASFRETGAILEGEAKSGFGSIEIAPREELGAEGVVLEGGLGGRQATAGGRSDESRREENGFHERPYRGGFCLVAYGLGLGSAKVVES